MPSLILALLLAGAAGAQGSAQPPFQQPVIVTTGDAIVRKLPDRAFVMIAVESRAKNPRDAQRDNAEAMTAVQQRLAVAKIPKDAIRTVAYGLDQEFDYVQTGRVPRGFAARNTIEVRVDDLSLVGDVIDAVVRGGATSVDSLRFDVRDRAALEREALRLAVTDARGRAEAAASGAGQAIDLILRIEDSREGIITPPRPMVMSRTAEAAATTPIEPGIVEVRAHVTLTVAMK
jgi:uncharacterized protein YggE